METERVILELEATGDPIRGSLQGENAEPLRFAGYVELISALETLRGAGSNGQGTGHIAGSQSGGAR